MPVNNIIFDSSSEIIKNKNLKVFMTFSYKEPKKQKTVIPMYFITNLFYFKI